MKIYNIEYLHKYVSNFTMKELYNLDSGWQTGDKLTARFQYSIPLFGREGKLTFTLYDANTTEALGSDSVTFKH